MPGQKSIEQVLQSLVRLRELVAPLCQLRSPEPLGLQARLAAAEQAVQGLSAGQRPSEEVCHLACLADDVDCLRSPDDEFAARLLQLSRNWQAVDSLAYEMKVAAHYVRRGLPIRFVPAAQDPNVRSHEFDVLGNPCFHVECKRVEPDSFPRKRHEAASRALAEVILPSLIEWGWTEATLESGTFLADEDVAMLAPLAIARAAAGEAGAFDLPAGRRLYLTKDGQAKAASTAMTYRVGEERIRIKTGRATRRTRFEVACPSVPDRTRQALALIQDACDQLPSAGVGVVWLSVTGMTKLGLGGDLRGFLQRVEAKLVRFPHVAACVVSHEGFGEGPLEGTWQHVAWAVRNRANPQAASNEMVPAGSWFELAA